MRFAARQTLLTALMIVALGGCGEDDNPTAPSCVGITTIDYIEPDFALADDNPNSATHAQDVSPRSCLGEISAWYFGHST